MPSLPSHSKEVDDLIIGASKEIDSLDQKLRRRNQLLSGRLKAWGHLLDAAGWCVALDLPGGTPWVGENAKADLATTGSVPTTWTALLDLLKSFPQQRLHLKSEGVRLWSGASGQPPDAPPPPHLTAREAEILGWLRHGKTGPEIALILGCKLRTVEKHVANLYRKIGAHDRASAILNNRAGPPP